MSSSMAEYFEALDRLNKGANKVVPKGTRITNDSVALEAGRGKGSIKKSRPVFTALIAAIEAAASEQAQPINDAKSKLKAAKEDTARYKAMWLQTLSREQSLVKQLWDVPEGMRVQASAATLLRMERYSLAAGWADLAREIGAAGFTVEQEAL